MIHPVALNFQSVVLAVYGLERERLKDDLRSDERYEQADGSRQRPDCKASVHIIRPCQVLRRVVHPFHHASTNRRRSYTRHRNVTEAVRVSVDWHVDRDCFFVSTVNRTLFLFPVSRPNFQP